LKAADLDKVGRWLVSPRFREEGPPTYVYSLLSVTEVEGARVPSDIINKVVLLVLLGHRPVTVLAIFSTLAQNENRPMYGTELGKVLESKFDLPEGPYTKARYYEDRVGKTLRLLSTLGLVEEKQVSLAGSQRRTTGYRLSGDLYRFMKYGRGDLESFVSFFPAGTRGVLKTCINDKFVTFEEGAEFCQFCGKPLSRVCTRCDKVVMPEYQFCIKCGAKIL